MMPLVCTQFQVVLQSNGPFPRALLDIKFLVQGGFKEWSQWLPRTAQSDLKANLWIRTEAQGK